MLLSHAVLFAEARSYLSALADSANGFDASLEYERCLLYTSPSPRDKRQSRMPSSA